MTSRRKFRSALDEQTAQEREQIAQFERDGIAWEFVYDTYMDAPYVARPELNGLRTYIRRLDGGSWAPRLDVFRTPPPFHP